MGIPVAIIGESGTGKTASLRNFKSDEVAYVNVAGKPLPFRGSFDETLRSEDFSEIKRFMQGTKKKVIVIDDSQYIMAYAYMRRIKETGWDKFNEIQSDMFNLIDLVPSLPPDTIIFFLTHLETTEDGRQKMKTIGKMLDEKITLEGMFAVVLKTYIGEGRYYFVTQNSGSDTVKSPLGMFDSFAIDNDLKYVSEKIKNYYQIGDYVTDEAITQMDEAAKRTDIERAGRGRVKRASRNAEKPVEKEKPVEAVMDDIPDDVVPWDENYDPEKAKAYFEKQAEPQTTRRTRKVRN